jgi:hypothetical protein
MPRRTPKAGADKPAAKRTPKAPARKPRAAGAAKAPAAGTVYQVKITLDNVRPPVWRRVLLKKDCTLAQLHHVIQVSMGWDDYHLHLFKVGDEEYGDPFQWSEPDPWGEQDVADEGEVELGQLVDRGKRGFKYVYDMGDDWYHSIRIEKTLPAEAGVHYPRCVEGERACPPEDCGGPWGYADLLQALREPQTERQEELLEWIGGEFDAEKFDAEAVNKRLAGLGRRGRR